MEGATVSLESLLTVTSGSIYKATILVAKRALTLADGEKPLVGKPSEKVLDSALREIEAGKIKAREKK